MIDLVGKFNTVVIDPPWPIGKIHKRKSLPDKKNHNQRPLDYQTMTVEEIKNLPIGGLTNVGAHVYLWTTNSMLRVAFDVLESWGIRYHLAMPLVKKSGVAPCNGYVFAAEYCLLGSGTVESKSG